MAKSTEGRREYAAIPAAEESLDYITLMPTVDHNRMLVVVMHRQSEEAGYVIRRCSDALSEKGARLLQAKWAQDLKLEIR